MVLGRIAFVLAIIQIIINISFLFVEFKKRCLTPAFIFTTMQIIMIVGILFLADIERTEDAVLILLYVIGDLFFIFFYNIFIRNFRYSLFRMKIKKEYKSKDLTLVVVLLLSITLSFLFFAKAGINLFTFFLNAFKSGLNISQVRKSINYTSGNGLIYQLRNFIIPIICISLLFSKKKYKVVSIFTIPLAFLLLIGSGQRAGLVFLFLSIAVFAFYKISIKKGKVSFNNILKKIFPFFVVILLIFVFLTVLNGRNEVSGSIFNAVIERVFHDNQFCAIYGFRYIYNSNITMGKDWAGMLGNIIGSSNYIPVSSFIHGELYGSLEGTSPPCIWGSAYYNFGFFGVLLLSFFASMVSVLLYKSFCTKRNSTFSIVCYSFLFVLFGTWIADSPTTLINGGFVVVLALLYFERFTRAFSTSSYNVCRNPQFQ